MPAEVMVPARTAANLHEYLVCRRGWRTCRGRTPVPSRADVPATRPRPDFCATERPVSKEKLFAFGMIIACILKARRPPTRHM